MSEEFEALLQQGKDQREAGQYSEALKTFSYLIKYYPQSDEAWKERGNVRADQGNLEAAIDDFTQAINLNPNYAKAYYNRGNARSKLGNLDGAIADFSKALEIDPDYATAYHNRGLARANQGDLEDAITDYTEALKIDSNDAAAYLNRGTVRYKQRDLDGAIADFTQAIYLNLNFWQAYLNRGIVRSKQGNLEDAIADFTQAIYLNPNFWQAYLNRGDTRRQQGNLEATIADYTEALEINPDYTPAYLNRGNVRYDQGDLDGAIADFTQALEIDSNDAAAYLNRGTVRYKQRDLDGAIADFTQALEIDSNDAVAYFNRGNVRYEQGDLDGAIADYTEALKIDSNNAPAYLNRGNAHSEQGNLDGAIADFTQALEIDSNDAVAYFNRGNAHGEQGNLEDAITDFTQALEIDSNYAVAYFNRGNAHGEQGNLDGAIADYTQALEIDSNYAEAYYNRGITRYRQGDLEDAIADCTEVIKLNPNYAEAYQNRGTAKTGLLQYEAAIFDFDHAISLKPDDYHPWMNRSEAIYKSQGLFYSVSITLPEHMQNYDLDKRGYEGSIATLTEGLKYVPEDSEGSGELHHQLGSTHYAQGCTFFWGENRQHSYHYFNLAKKAFKKALEVLTENDYPEAHLEVLSDYIRLFYALEQSEKAEGFQVKAANILDQLLNSPDRSPFQKRQLALKFYNLRQLAVQALIRGQEFTQALTQAEKDKNGCLQWLLKQEWINPKQINSPSLDELQKQLPANSAVIYWYLSPVALSTFIITPHHPPQLLETAELNSNLRSQQFNALQQLLQQCREQQKQWRKQLQNHLETLESLLNIPELVNQLPDNLEQLLLVPHRDLHRLPLHALFLDYLLPSVTVRYLPSLQTQLTLQQPKTQPRTYDLLTLQGNSKGLEWVDRELSEISSYFQAPSYLSQEAKPNWDTFTETLQQSQGILHYCGHAKYNYQQPSQSQLKFNLYYDDQNEPKPLTAEQICKLDLTAYNLTVLSGCETGITGTQEVETEYFGLGSAFLSSGVNCVVSTLWKVSDIATLIVMKEFYEQVITQGVAKPLALKLAAEKLKTMTPEDFNQKYAPLLKQEYRNSLKLQRRFSPEDFEEQIDNLADEFKNPDYWAAFICQGGESN